MQPEILPSSLVILRKPIPFQTLLLAPVSIRSSDPITPLVDEIDTADDFVNVEQKLAGNPNFAAQLFK